MRFISCLFDSILFCCLALGFLFVLLHLLTWLSVGSLFFTGSPAYGLHVIFFLLSAVAINLLFLAYVVHRLLAVGKTAASEPWRVSEVVRVFGFDLTLTPLLFFCLVQGHKPIEVALKPALVTAGLPQTLIPVLVDTVERNGPPLIVLFVAGIGCLILHAFLKRDFDSSSTGSVPPKNPGE